MNSSPTLFDLPPPQAPTPMVFKGCGLDEDDLPRLNTNARRVWDSMLQLQQHNDYVSLNAVADGLRIPHSSVTACVRGFRNDENGGHAVLTKRAAKGKGTWLYRLVPNTPEGIAQARARVAAKEARKAQDELLELRAWIGQQVALNGWQHSPFSSAIVARIETMVQARPPRAAPKPKKEKKANGKQSHSD